MSDTILIDALAGTLPEGFCPTGPTALQDLYNEFVARTQWSLAVGIRFFNFGDTEPTPDFRVYPWFRTIAGYPDKWYVYVGAAPGPSKWLSLHPIPAGPNGLRQGWVGTSVELEVYDGGEAGVATITTGPFWEIDHGFDGRSPMGPGAIPSSDPAKILSAAEDYGAGSYMLTEPQITPHTHPLTADASIQNGENIKVVDTGAGGPGLQIGLTGPPSQDLSVDLNFSGAQEAVQVIHPVRGRYEIKRTMRQYYRGT